MPLRAAASAVTWAANGVDLREPLKPAPPAAIAADLHQALDVLGALTAQVALDHVLAVDQVAELDHLVLGEVADVGVGRDVDLREDLVRARPADAVDVRQPDLDALVQG